MQSQIDQFYEKVDMQSHIDRLEQSFMKKFTSNHTDEREISLLSPSFQEKVELFPNAIIVEKYAKSCQTSRSLTLLKSC